MVDPWPGDGEDCLRKDVAESDVGDGDMRVASKDRETAHAYDQLIPPGAPCVTSYCVRALILLSLSINSPSHTRACAEGLPHKMRRGQLLLRAENALRGARVTSSGTDEFVAKCLYMRTWCATFVCVCLVI